MTSVRNFILQVSLCNLIYYLSLLIVVYLDFWLNRGQDAYLIYLPAGVVFLSLLIFGTAGAIGIMTALIFKYTNLNYSFDALEIAAFAICSVFLQLLIIKIVIRVLKLDDRLSKIKHFQILLLGLVWSIAHGTSHSYMLWRIHQTQEMNVTWNIVGDFLGVAFALFLIILLRSFKRFYI
jgi:hypothetical protein